MDVSKIVLVVSLILLALILLFFLIAKINMSNLKKIFKGGNVIVFGKKGKGKDLLFQNVIKHRKKPYYSNIDYGYKLEKIVNVGDINVNPNTYIDFIKGSTKKVKLPLKQDLDVYISDCGVCLPSQYDTQLSKLFPSFPIYYALSRHLTNSNIHCNTQALNRVWIKLREQADYFIKCRSIIKLPFFIIENYTIYDRYQSALNDVRCSSSRLFNKYSKAENDVYNAENGEVKNGFVIISKRSIRYDTRYFRRVLDVDCPKK